MQKNFHFFPALVYSCICGLISKTAKIAIFIAHCLGERKKKLPMDIPYQLMTMQIVLDVWMERVIMSLFDNILSNKLQYKVQNLKEINANIILC